MHRTRSALIIATIIALSTVAAHAQGMGRKNPVGVPEPASIALLGVGLVGLAGLRFRRRG